MSVDASRCRYGSHRGKPTSQNYLVCVDYLGMILHVDGPHPGRRNDRQVFIKSELYQNRARFLSDDEYILADGGFIEGDGYLVPIHQNTYDRMTDGETRQIMLDYNQEFTANRLIVEDVFGWLKERACVLNRAWPRDLSRQAEMFNAACKFHNFVRMIRIDYAMQLPQMHSNQ